MTLSKEELDWAVRHWTTANYLAAASIYLKDNFFLETPLQPEHIKDSLLGHWGTCPGINFVFTHLNLLAYKTKQKILPIIGPGHGFAAILANTLMDGTLEKYYPDYTNTKEGIGKMIKGFCWPGKFPSHANPSIPGILHEGGELGYALSTAFGAAFDNPDLLVAVMIGDGEAETGPTATAWHSNKFLNPVKDGAVLPILHLNGYKINSPTIYGTMDDDELKKLFQGYGYQPIFVGENHKDMASALHDAHEKIKLIKRQNPKKPQWPMILLRTRKGWTGIKEAHGEKIEGSFRSHQVPLRDVKTNAHSLNLLKQWLKKYDPDELFPNQKISAETTKYLPKERLTDNPHANGGNFRKLLKLPSVNEHQLTFSRRGLLMTSTARVLGSYLKDIIKLNKTNFIIVSPDELASNKLDAVLGATGRRYIWKEENDSHLRRDGRVFEMLSEHTLQGWLQGYLLTGRHGIFPSYEAFLPIIDSMVAQYLKFIKVASEQRWRKPVSALNYLLTSVCWRQDHNGFSHQNPGFINVLLDKAKEEQLVRFYFPADANTLLAISEHALQSTNRVNIIVSDKQPIKQWLTYKEAVEQCKKGAGIWQFASQSDPDVVLAACGDYQTQEMLAAIKLLKDHVPELKARFVNVSELNVLGQKEFYPNGMDDTMFEELFTKDRDVVFSFHGYPATIKQMLFDRINTRRFDICGYIESGSTTTPFDMLVRNHVSRYDIAEKAIEHAAKHNQDIAKKADSTISYFREKLVEHRKYIMMYGKDPEEIDGWTW